MDKNTVAFQSPLHQNLWRSSINVLPLERTTAWITDENLLTSCRQLYSYVMDAYDDILENPQLYGLDPHNLPNQNSDNIFCLCLDLFNFLFFLLSNILFVFCCL